MSGAADKRGVASDDLAAAFSDRFGRSLAKAERAIAEVGSEGRSLDDATTSPEYQEIMLLKVRLELEAARILSTAARLGAELVETAEGLRTSAGAAPR